MVLLYGKEEWRRNGMEFREKKKVDGKKSEGKLMTARPGLTLT